MMLYTVGPVHVMPETLQSMVRPMITHRSREYKELHSGIIEKIKKALDVDMDVFLVAGSSTVLLESSIRNGVNRKSLGITNGAFGDRLIEIGNLNGKTVEGVYVPWGSAIKPEHIVGKVTNEIEAVHWVSNESSTGVFSNSVKIANEIRAQNPEALIIIDAVTSAFAMDLKIKDVDPDSIVFSTQKALALPPGLSIMLCSERLISRAKYVSNRGFYTDLIKIKNQSNANYTLTTPPISIMYGLDYQLDRILNEGMQSRYRRHKDMADLVTRWANRKLAGIFPEYGCRSNSISVLNKGSLNFDLFYSELKSEGYEISNGYGDIKHKTFRIGHMGDIKPKNIQDLLLTFDEILEK